MKSFHQAGTYLDEVGVLCASSITGTLSPTYWTGLFSKPQNILVNLAYNAGYMWVDAVNYLYYTPSTLVDGDWAYFMSFLLGDFTIRIFYHDPTPDRIKSYTA